MFTIKTAVFASSLGAQSQVAYLIHEDAIFFTQIAGVYSSINGAESIVEEICKTENLSFRNFKWIDIQRRPRYTENCTDELIFECQGEIPCVIYWNPIEVSLSVIEALILFKEIT